MFRMIPALAMCALCNTATAQVYKCRIDGKLAYGDQRCAAGPTVELAVPAAAATAADAARQLSRDQAALRELEQLRMASELRAQREQRDQARLHKAAAARRQKCDRLRLRRKWADEDLARTTGAALEAARIKARRQGEVLAVECPA
jgi:hypothetical protein